MRGVIALENEGETGTLGSEGSGSARKAPVVALLLSAGESYRFGSAPKALASLDGESAIARMARVARSVGVSDVVAVLGAHSGEIGPVLERIGVRFVHHPDWSQGRTGSIQAGLSTLEPGVDLLLWPVDHPFVRGSTLSDILSEAALDGVAGWFVPTFGGHGGHPVLIRAPLLPYVRALGPDEPLRRLLPRLGPQIRRLPVADPWVVSNVDTQEAFAAALSRWRTEG
jgi:molybdenum cofactor cytidylyltransferase